MTRNRYIAHDQDREDLKVERRTERKAWGTEALAEESKDEGEKKVDAEFASVEAFATYLLDDDQESFTHQDLQGLHESLSRSHRHLRRELEEYGFKMARRAKVHSVRGFTANPHNRWAGNPMCAGGGGSAIMGMVD